jgi:hypothetical protein
VARLFVKDNYIEIIPECDEDHKKAIDIPYVHATRNRKKYYTTPLNIGLVLKLFRNITVDKTPLKTVIEHFLYVQEAVQSGPKSISNWLMPHQQLACEIAEHAPRFAFFYDTRTGKTPMSLQIIVNDIEKNPTNKWLILCPLILIENAWLEDIRKFFPNLEPVVLHAKTKAKRLQQFQKKSNIYIANIESFVSYYEYIDKLGIHGCIVDESSAMKSAKSKFSKAAVEFSRKMKRWYLLSGTPAPNGEWEYYSQIRSVDYYGVHQSFTQFKNHFFQNVSFNPQYEKLALLPSRKQEMLELLKRYSMYVDKEQVLTTPGREFKTVELDMPADLKAKYDLTKKELYTEVEEKKITTEGAAAVINKLNQISSGFIIDTKAKEFNKYHDEKKQETYLLSMYRFNALLELLNSIDGQVLIWANYHYEFEVIKNLLKDKCKLIYGKTSNEDKNAAIKAFKDGSIEYLVANPASADKGLTLTNANYSVYFSLNYSYELFKQSMERIYGGTHSQKNFCTYYIFIAKGTVNKLIYSALNNKKDLSYEVLDHLKGML